LLEEILNSELKQPKKEVLRLLSSVDSQKASRMIKRQVDRTFDPEPVYQRAAGLLAAYGDEEAKTFIMQGRPDNAEQLAVWWMLKPQECAAAYEQRNLPRGSEPDSMAQLYAVSDPSLARRIVEALSAYGTNHIEISLYAGLRHIGGGFKCFSPSQNDFDTFPEISEPLFGIESPLQGDAEIELFRQFISNKRWLDISRKVFRSIESHVANINGLLEPQARQVLAMTAALKDNESTHYDWLVAEASFSLFLTVKHLGAAQTLLERRGDIGYLLRAWQHVKGRAETKIERLLLEHRSQLQPGSDEKRLCDERIRDWVLNSLEKSSRAVWVGSGLGVGLMPGLICLAKRHDIGGKDLERIMIEASIRKAIRAERHYLTPAKVRELLRICETVQRGVLQGLAHENCHWAAQLVAERWDEFDGFTRHFASEALYELADPAVYETMKDNFPNDDRSWDRRAMKRVELAQEQRNIR
jgi:hypothetical protein